MTARERAAQVVAQLIASAIIKDAVDTTPIVKDATIEYIEQAILAAQREIIKYATHLPDCLSYAGGVCTCGYFMVKNTIEDHK